MSVDKSFIEFIKGEIRSNVKKLWRHIDFIKSIDKNKRALNVITCITSKCNLHCSFCYVLNRSRKEELDFDKLKHFISIVNPLAVEISGGEPTLYPYINEYIEFLVEKEIHIGMITNGSFLDRIKNENLQKIDWIRISINNYIENNIEFVDPPYPEKIGYNYIKHKNSPKDLNKRLINFMKNHRGEYLKVPLDITDPRIKKKFKDVPEYNIVGQDAIIEKRYKGICYMAWLKPMVEPDGFVYPCPGNVDNIIRDKNKEEAICTIDNPEYLVNYKPILVDCLKCCSFDKNEFVEYILEEYVENEEFT